MRHKLLLLLSLFSINIFAQQTYIPDDAFEQFLIKEGYDDVLDDYVLTANINSIETLRANGKNILDFTGINDFVSLKVLYVYSNFSYTNGVATRLSSLDITNLVNLEILDIGRNNISSIDLSNNTKLIELKFNDNNFSSINLDSNTELEVLDATNNNLSNLDLSNNTKLKNINISKNNITSTLDLSNQSINPTNFKCFGKRY